MAGRGPVKLLLAKLRTFMETSPDPKDSGKVPDKALLSASSQTRAGISARLEGILPVRELSERYSSVRLFPEPSEPKVDGIGPKRELFLKSTRYRFGGSTRFDGIMPKIELSLRSRI